MGRDALFRRRIRIEFPAIGKVFLYEDRTDVYLMFRVPFGTSAGSTIGEATLVNLSAATIAKLKPGDPMILAAGYRGTGLGKAPELETVLAGEIVQVDTKWKGVDKHTVVQIGDAHETWLSRRVNKDWKPGTRVRKVVRDLCRRSTLPLGEVQVNAADNFDYEDGFITAANETIKSALETVRRDLLHIKGADYEVHVAQGRIHFHSADKAYEHSGVLISAETGMIGQLEPIARSEPSDPDKEGEEQKFSCSVMLKYGGRLWADKMVDIRSRVTGGEVRTFKILEGTHVASPEKQFQTDLTVQEYR